MPADRQPEPLDPEAGRANVDDLIKLRDSRGWQLLMLALSMHAEEAKNELVDCDPANTAEMVKLQNETNKVFIKTHEVFLKMIKKAYLYIMILDLTNIVFLSTALYFLYLFHKALPLCSTQLS